DQKEDWQSDGAYDEDPPTCVHYSLEWRVTSNGKPISKDTEPNLVLSPSAFWQRTLHSRLDRLVGRKMGDADIAKAEETSITVSVTDRSERDLTKQFDELDIDWTVIEGQLVEWSDLFRRGKKLRVDITFHYVTPSILLILFSLVVVLVVVVVTEVALLERGTVERRCRKV
ncbi:hypothetical protein LTR70_010701, partial [Exophiala xenobiotica]